MTRRPSTPPFRRVLVANRGEIAVRICRGLRELGIESVVVHSDVDRTACHVAAGDVAVPIGGETAAESYLVIDKVLDAAKQTGAEAVHPGYGFLSENPAFAAAVAEAGLVFIGPEPASMKQLGSKTEARAVAEAAGVPTVPGWQDDDGDDARLAERAREVGTPLMIKASAGGGGKGMRLVEDAADIEDAIAAARREAKAAFGDDRMLLERYVFPSRHIEVQILADHHGDVVSLHERECSVQRRHQKVLEEAPSPAVDADLRRRMGEAATELARHVGYRNAGTVEFLVDEQGSFYFLEVNTRLQVEHPVTELVTGLDLVELQVHIAAGARLADLLPDGAPPPRGHAIEARIYAEAPERGYLPAAGRLQLVHEPAGPGIRVDSGVRTGDEVSVHYDPMLAKLVVHAPTREAACDRLVAALEDSFYLGIPSNVDFLARVVADEDFRAGNLRTDFLALKPDLATGPTDVPDPSVFAAAGLARCLAPSAAAGGGSVAGADSGRPPEPWDTLGAMRLWPTSATEGSR